MHSRFGQYWLQVLLLLAGLFLATFIVLPLTNENRQTLSLEAEKDLKTGVAKNTEKDSQRSPRIDSHNDLLNILRRNEPAKVTQSPISQIDTSELSQPTEAQRENSLQNRNNSDGDR